MEKNDFDKVWDFENLYKAHKKARLGKRDKTEVISFEMNLSENLIKLSESIKNKTYRISGYYSFMVYDPKEREIQALHYPDRIVQHCLCDEVLQPLLDRHLIYDNAACRKEKGTLFAIQRVTSFMQKYYWQNGPQGYVLKCDIRKYFHNIDHLVLKKKLRKVISNPDILWMLDLIIDSYEYSPGKGLPMGNQTSQWFALYYLDGLDRMIKESFRIKYYSRYMDDCLLIHWDKGYLKNCLKEMSSYLEKELQLQFNEKTQIFPLRNGLDYIGFHFYLTDTGRVVKKIRRRTKVKYKKKLAYYMYAYPRKLCEEEQIRQTINSYHAHFSHGNTWHLERKILSNAAFHRYSSYRKPELRLESIFR